MLKKSLLLPTILFPYVSILIFGLFTNLQDDLGAASGRITQYRLVGTLALFVLCIIFNVAFMISGKNEAPSAIMRRALIVKCLHIPVYILVFVHGLICTPLFVMLHMVIFLLICFDLAILSLSSMISIYAVVKALKNEDEKLKVPLVITLACQFFFCADVISMLIMNILMKLKAHCQNVLPR